MTPSRFESGAIGVLIATSSILRLVILRWLEVLFYFYELLNHTASVSVLGSSQIDNMLSKSHS